MGGRLEEKVAVITGGTSGIGEATAELFVAEGARVVICGRSVDKGQAVAARLGENCRFMTADITQEADIKRTIEATVSEFGQLDILFNNAGGPTHGLVDAVEEEAIIYATRLLFSSAALAMKHAIPFMRQIGGGAIINNSSVAALRDSQGDLVYSAVKAALTHYSKLAGVRLGPEGIRVNCISPGAIATPIFWGGSARANTLSAEENDQKMQKLQANLAKATPLKFSGLAMDIAQGALYLASEEGRFINCHDLVIDGGRTSMFNEPA
jgi:NAD(P)-dependent dehydrogenase (short-subunit alcohol dehydrogenase family)